MKVSWLLFSIKEITLNAPFIDLVEFSLVHVQICFSQRPCMGHCKAIKLVSDFQKIVVDALKAIVDLALPITASQHGLSRSRKILTTKKKTLTFQAQSLTTSDISLITL